MTAGEIIRRREFPYAVIACLGAVAVGLAIWHPLAALDTFCRYAFMAEEFAKANWQETFHPRFGVGFPLVSGCLHWLTGLDGYRCCAFASTAAWAVGMIPLFRICDRIFGREAAWFSIALYVVCPQTFIWALKGLRDPFRMAGVLLMTSAVVTRCREGSGGLAEAMIGFPLMCLFRGDALVQACFLTGVFVFVDRLKVRSWILLGWSAAMIQVMCWLVWTWTRCWVPVYEAVGLFRRYFGG